MGTTTLETPAWLMSGVITYNAKPGTLRLDGARLSFRETGEEAAVFDIALADIDDVKFPAYNFGSVVRIDAGANRHRVAFLAAKRRFTCRAPGCATSVRHAAGAGSGRPRSKTCPRPLLTRRRTDVARR